MLIRKVYGESFLEKNVNLLKNSEYGYIKTLLERDISYI